MKAKSGLILLALLFVFTVPMSAVAENDGGEIVYKDTGKMGPVHFSHKEHLEKGNKCEDCHDSIFQKKAGTADAGNALTMKSLKAGNFCGVCHDGDKAFTARSHCKRCHIKSE